MYYAPTCLGCLAVPHEGGAVPIQCPGQQGQHAPCHAPLHRCRLLALAPRLLALVLPVLLLLLLVLLLACL